MGLPFGIALEAIDKNREKEEEGILEQWPFVGLSSHWMCWGLGRPSPGQGRQQILFAARNPCFPGKKQSKKMIHQRLHAKDPATNIRCVREWDF